MTDSAKIEARLGELPETLLWNLYQRATEAGRPDGVLTDPKAVALVERIGYPFRDRFGGGGLGQWQALRARCFDLAVQRFLASHPAGTVVALGEGLETQFWRVDNGQVRWLTVDLPETIELRRALLPAESPRQRMIACSALSADWLAELTGDPAEVLLTAQGLLMYFQPEEVHRLVAACAAGLPGSALVFDGVPRWFSDRTLAGTMRTRQGYQAPPMPWAVDKAELARLRSLPGVAGLTELRLPRGRGAGFGAVYPVLNRIAAVRRLGVTGLPVMMLRFRG
ncbi:MAG: class I SAM-dependent methyltransferase [Actinobacteria bacterium]|nr:class I SAM-dependent methyltransferase [Actinomycetota bacterium]